MALPKDLQEALDKAVDRGWRAQLNIVLKHCAWKKVNPGRGVMASNRTIELRGEVLHRMFEELHEAKLKVAPHNIRKKHVDYLVEKWISEELKPATLQNKLSHLRTFCKWIGKAGLVPPNDKTFKGREKLIKRTYVATRDVSPEAAGVKSEQLFADAKAIDPIYNIMVRMIRIMDFRNREVVCFRPHAADFGHYVSLFPKQTGKSTGSKSKRGRIIPVNTQEKRALIDEARAAVRPGMALGWSDGLPDGLNQSYRRLMKLHQKIGMTRRDRGFTAHNLRAAALADMAELDGLPVPVRGGDATGMDKGELIEKRMRLAEAAGHSRISITNAYIGSFSKRQPTKGNDNEQNRPDQGIAGGPGGP